MTDLLREAVARLKTAGVDSPRLDARLLWEHAKHDPSLFEIYVARRTGREPLAYILGRKEFWSLSFEVGPGVLVPRPETETVVERALAWFEDRSAKLTVLDFGTGSGCLPVAFLMEYLNASGLGLEKSEQARVFANRNIVRHGLSERCRIEACDWNEFAGARADVIFANPPYVRRCDVGTLKPELHFEPVEALCGGEDGLDAYRALAPVIARHLAPQGRAFLEIGIDQGAEVSALLAAAGLGDIRIHPDLAGIPRVLSAGCGDFPEKTVGKAQANR